MGHSVPAGWARDTLSREYQHEDGYLRHPLETEPGISLRGIRQGLTASIAFPCNVIRIFIDSAPDGEHEQIAHL